VTPRDKASQSLEILAPGLCAAFANIFEECRAIAREEAQKTQVANSGREEFLMPEELCEWLKIKPGQLAMLISTNEIKPTKIGQLNRFARTHIEEWLKSKVKGCDDPSAKPGLRKVK